MYRFDKFGIGSYLASYLKALRIRSQSDTPNLSKPKRYILNLIRSYGYSTITYDKRNNIMDR